MKRKKTSKVNPKVSKEPEKVVNETFPPFHESFPFTLTFNKDKEKKVCYFQCKEHLDSYLKRYKFKKTDYSIKKTEPREIDI